LAPGKIIAAFLQCGRRQVRASPYFFALQLRHDISDRDRSRRRRRDGDFAGDLLYATLLEYSFARGVYQARPDDGLALIDCRISNAVRCVPPQNKPLPVEINLPAVSDRDHRHMPRLRAIVALGRVAHESTLKALGLRSAAAPFAQAPSTTPAH